MIHASNFNNLCRDLIGGSLSIKGKLIIDKFCNITTENTLRAVNIVGGTYCGNARTSIIESNPKNGNTIIVDSNIFSANILTNEGSIIAGNILPSLENPPNQLGNNSSNGCWQNTFTSNIDCDIIQSKSTGFINVNGSLEPFDDCIFNLGSSQKTWNNVYSKKINIDRLFPQNGNSINIKNISKFLGNVCVTGNIKAEKLNAPDSFSDLYGNLFTQVITPKVGNSINILGDVRIPESTLFTTKIEVINAVIPDIDGQGSIGNTTLCWSNIFTNNSSYDVIQPTIKGNGNIEIMNNLQPLSSDTFNLGSSINVFDDIYSSNVCTDCIESISGDIDLKGNSNITGDLCVTGMIKFGSGTVASVNGMDNNVVLTTDDVPEGTGNLYYTDARVSASPDVFLNTQHRDANSGQVFESAGLSSGILLPPSTYRTFQLDSFGQPTPPSGFNSFAQFIFPDTIRILVNCELTIYFECQLQLFGSNPLPIRLRLRLNGTSNIGEEVGSVLTTGGDVGHHAITRYGSFVINDEITAQWGNFSTGNVSQVMARAYMNLLRIG